jgi:hypothetical protein
VQHKKLLFFSLLIIGLVASALLVKAQLDQSRDFPAHVTTDQAITVPVSYNLRVSWLNGSEIKLIEFGRLKPSNAITGQLGCTCPYEIKIENTGADIVYVSVSAINLTSNLSLRAWCGYTSTLPPPLGQEPTDLAGVQRGVKSAIMLKPNEAISVILTLIWTGSQPPEGGDLNFSIRVSVEEW